MKLFWVAFGTAVLVLCGCTTFERDSEPLDFVQTTTLPEDGETTTTVESGGDRCRVPQPDLIARETDPISYDIDGDGNADKVFTYLTEVGGDADWRLRADMASGESYETDLGSEIIDPTVLGVVELQNDVTTAFVTLPTGSELTEVGAYLFDACSIERLMRSDGSTPLDLSIGATTARRAGIGCSDGGAQGSLLQRLTANSADGAMWETRRETMSIDVTKMATGQRPTATVTETVEAPVSASLPAVLDQFSTITCPGL